MMRMGWQFRFILSTLSIVLICSIYCDMSCQAPGDTSCKQTVFYDDFETDDPGRPPALSPAGVPCADALHLQGVQESILVIDSVPHGSKAVKIDRAWTIQTILECVAECDSHQSGTYLVTFKGYNTHSGGNTPTLTISVKSASGQTAFRLIVDDGEYNLVSGAGVETLSTGYTVNVVDEITVRIDLDAGCLSLDINNSTLVSSKPFLDAGFVDLSILRFSYPLAILEAFPAAYVVDEIKICAATSTADRIFTNGQVVTMELDMPQAEALAIRGQNILAVGTNAEILALSGPETQVIDLDGKALLPGFVDPHNHRFNDALFHMGVTLEEAQQLALEGGTTTMANMYTDPYVLEQMQTFEQQGRLRVRTSLYLNYNTNCGETETWDGVPLGDWYKDRSQVLAPSQMLRIVGVKIFSDGGSCLRPAFSLDLPDWAVLDGPQGDLFVTEEELATVISEVQVAGYQAAIHALGDRAIETVLNAIETALDGQPNTYRHRIEHNSNIRPELLSRYGQLDIVPTMFGCPFTYWLMIPQYYMRGFMEMHGDEVRSWFNPVRSLLDANQGLHVAWKSDYPIPTGPVADLYGLVTRKQPAPDGVSVCEPPSWLAAQAITVEEALRMMTIEAAYALFMEDCIGSLKPGKFADLVVLSDNPLTMQPDSLIDLKVLLTVVGGRVEYSVPGLDLGSIGGSITGHIYQSDGVTPIQGATVVVLDDPLMRMGQWIVRGRTVTDEQGYYVVSGLPSYRYAVTVRAGEGGYATEWYQDTQDFTQRTRVSVTALQDTPNIDFTLDIGGTISGQVTFLENGTPIPVANLDVYAIDTQTGQWMAGFITDAEGHYTLGLPAGSYWVRAYGPFTGLNYVPEWYDGVYNTNEAMPVMVTVGQDTSDIDFILEPGGL